MAGILAGSHSGPQRRGRGAGAKAHLARRKAFSGPAPLRGRPWFLVSAESTTHRGSTSHLVEREKRSNSEGEIR